MYPLYAEAALSGGDREAAVLPCGTVAQRGTRPTADAGPRTALPLPAGKTHAIVAFHLLSFSPRTFRQLCYWPWAGQVPSSVRREDKGLRSEDPVWIHPVTLLSAGRPGCEGSPRPGLATTVNKMLSARMQIKCWMEVQVRN